MANERARTLRKSMSESEWKLWRELRKRQVGGHRFRRQHPIGPYVVDFVCLEQRFIVEVDGGHHSETAQVEYDGRRTEWLEREGYRVFRVWNTEVFDNLDGVVETIWTELNGLRSRPSQTPPPWRARIT
jgi:very-short-patch-repair endonuclease